MAVQPNRMNVFPREFTTLNSAEKFPNAQELLAITTSGINANTELDDSPTPSVYDCFFARSVADNLRVELSPSLVRGRFSHITKH